MTEPLQSPFPLDPQRVQNALIQTRIYLQGRGAEQDEDKLILSSIKPRDQKKLEKQLDAQPVPMGGVAKRRKWSGHELPQTLLKLPGVVEQWKTSDDVIASWKSAAEVADTGSRENCMFEALSHLAKDLGVHITMGPDELREMREASERARAKSNRLALIRRIDRPQLDQAIQEMYSEMRPAQLKDVPREERQLFAFVADYRIEMNDYARNYTPGHTDVLHDLARITQNNISMARELDEQEREDRINRPGVSDDASKPGRYETIMAKAAGNLFAKLGIAYDAYSKDFAPYASEKKFTEAFGQALEQIKSYSLFKRMDDEARDRFFRRVDSFPKEYDSAFHPGLYLSKRLTEIPAEHNQRAAAKVLCTLTLRDLGNQQLNLYAREHFDPSNRIRQSDISHSR